MHSSITIVGRALLEWNSRNSGIKLAADGSLSSRKEGSFDQLLNDLFDTFLAELFRQNLRHVIKLRAAFPFGRTSQQISPGPLGSSFASPREMERNAIAKGNYGGMFCRVTADPG